MNLTLDQKLQDRHRELSALCDLFVEIQEEAKSLICFVGDCDHKQRLLFDLEIFGQRLAEQRDRNNVSRRNCFIPQGSILDSSEPA